MRYASGEMRMHRTTAKRAESISRREFLVGALGVGFTTGGGGSLINERNQIDITHHVLKPEALLAGGRVSFAQLSDLHLHRIGRHEERIAEAVNRLRPDFLAITGDTIDQADRVSVLDSFLGLLDPMQGFAVLGNWEHRSQVDLAVLERTYALHNINLLVNQSGILEHRGKRFLVTGLDDLVGGSPSLERALGGVKPSAQHLILAHCPAHRDVLLHDAAWGTKLNETPPIRAGKNGDVLILSGHTHGGQVCLGGWAPVLPRGSGRYVAGWYTDGAIPLYVSRGLGTTMLPIRFGAVPEIAYFEIAL
jgi:predicted MPP superfamily phosphohydrolase